ncbi:MAG TPA: hypothetical protein VKU00_13940 [Chthonomonadaceae bacterium]|nr:hypothetical protein [Chthonomonadaceae bacterium]
MNIHKVATDWDYSSPRLSPEFAELKQFDLQAEEQKAITALPQLMAGKEYRTEDKSWDILMRPVLASKQACLSCHTNVQPGATLGVIVYAVRKVKHSASGKPTAP